MHCVQKVCQDVSTIFNKTLNCHNVTVFPLKVNPLNLKFSNQAKNTPQFKFE